MNIHKSLLAGALAVSVCMSQSSSTVKDADGNVYHAVKIGKQVWTVENLRTTKYNDGTAIPLVTDNSAWKALATPGYCYCNNTTNADTITKYGVLYNWYAINTKKLAPRGWHVPSNVDWDILENYLIANGYNWDGTTTSCKIAKSLAAKSDWQKSIKEGAIGNDLMKNNRSGFSALPGGCRYHSGSFDGIGYGGNWWSSTEDDASSAYGGCGLHYDSDNIGMPHHSSYKRFGYFVRLVRDWDADGLSTDNRKHLESSSATQQPNVHRMFRVCKVESWDVLNIRSSPDPRSPKIGEIHFNGKGIIRKESRTVGKNIWFLIEYNGVQGWVNSAFLTSE